MNTTQPPSTTTSTQRRPGGLLINHDFALLWGGQAVSAIGDSTFATTLVLWVVTLIARRQPWTPLAVSGVLLATIAPELLISPFAGVFADRWNKRRTMLVMDAMRAVLVLLLPLATGIAPLPFVLSGHVSVAWQLGAIYCTVFLASSCAQFFNPSLAALIAAIVEDPLRARASGLRQGASSLAAVVGPALAAALFFGAGIEWALLLNALSFVVSFAAILGIRTRSPAPQDIALEEHAGFLDELRAGVRFYFGNRVLVTLLVTGVLTLLGFGALNTLDIFFVTQNLRAAPSLYGILTSVQGVGLIAGATFAAIFAQRIGLARVLGLSLLAWGVVIVIYARQTSIAPALALMGLTGFLLATAQVAETPLLMRVTPQHFLGRVVSVLMPAMSAAELVGIGLSGYVDSTALRHLHVMVIGVVIGPVDTIFTVVGLSVLAGGAYALLSLRGLSPAQETAPDAASTPG